MEFNILITGDYCPIGRNSNAIEKKDFDFLSDFIPFVKKADFAITNLEAPTTTSTFGIIKSGPNIKVNKNSLLPLNEVGFNLVTLANNHILDYDQKGIKDTIKNCKDFNIETVGAGENIIQARKAFVLKQNGFNIAILNFAENEFCAATKNTYGANPINLITNHKDIKKAKEENDFVLVIAHGGREHYQLPTPQLRERYRFFIESGADAVVGHHTHCFSGYEYYNNKPIFYSLGNFIFDYKKKYQKGTWTQGYGVMLKISKLKTLFDLIPYNQGRESNPKLKLLSKVERKLFDTKIKELNTIIEDDDLFEKAWGNYIKTQEINYKSNLFIQNKYLRALQAKKILPPFYFHSKTHKTLLLNLLRCESHREIMIDVLNKK